MASSFKVRLKCPHGDQDCWLALHDRDEPLVQILATPWDFECPMHGVQREFPVEAHAELVSPPRRPRKPPAVTGRVAVQQRSGRRIPLHAQVLVYGRADGREFVEETSTLLVNAGGALLALTTEVGLGGTVFVVNKSTKEQQECRVAYVGPELDGRITVGIGFQRPTSSFWKIDGGNRPLFRTIRVPFLPWSYRRRKRYPRRRGSVRVVSQQASPIGYRSRKRSGQPATGQVILVLAASLVMGAIAPWGLTLVSRTWRHLLLPQSPELGFTQRPNQLGISNGLGVPTERTATGLSSTQATLPESFEPRLALKPIQLNVLVEAAKLGELSEPWSSKKFTYQSLQTRKGIAALVVRMPDGEPGRPGSYWAFSLETPVPDCQLEYVTDLQKLLTDYRFRAEHPMVGDPCTHSLFDPLQMGDLPDGNWARGAVAKGYALRPPVGIEVHIKGDRLMATKIEGEF